MNVIATGEGPIFTDPDPDAARAFFALKSRAMTDKLMSAKEAVEKLIPEGSYVASGGFGSNRISTVVLHEIMRARHKKLGFFGHTTTHDFQLMCAGETFDRLDASYIVGLEARGLSPCARRYIESGRVKVCEWSNYAMGLRLKAAAEGVPFALIRGLVGTDTFKYSAGKVVECPFTNKKVVAVPALYPDVAVIHVHEADRFGNCRIKGISVADLELSRASKRVVISTERLIDNAEIRRDPTTVTIPYYLVDAVIEQPFGSYPGNMCYEYFSDEDHLSQWLKVEKDPEQFAAFLDKYIYNVECFEEYVELCGGIKRLKVLAQQESLA